MISIRSIYAVLLFGFLPFLSGSNDTIIEQDAKVIMRMIGHQLLLKSGDSTSRVLPIKLINSNYSIDVDGDSSTALTHKREHFLIEFENEFEFDSDSLVSVVTAIMESSKLSNKYLVEVKSCETEEVVYSYSIKVHDDDFMPCRGRPNPKGCYQIMFTLLDNRISSLSEAETEQKAKHLEDSGIATWLLIMLLLATGAVAFYILKVKGNAGSDFISLGNFRFDPKNLELHYNQEKVELTHKEAELLTLLHSSANETITRETILNAVWGDEGTYDGRTLDVFISKLRKKLEPDSKVKISNVRGVGYRLIIN